MNYDNADNNAMLAAWNEWKVVCSILGCSPNNRALLKKEVGNAFRRKISSITFQDVHAFGTQKREGLTTRDGNLRDDENETYAHEFDVGIETKAKFPGQNKKTGVEKEKKNYKDIAWQIIATSNDPPLKVIRGMLLGGAGNYGAPLNAIVREYLEVNFDYRFDGRSIKYYPPKSLQEKQGDENERTLEDTIEALCTPGDISETDKKFLDKEIPARFSSKEAAVALALVCRIAVTEPVLLKFLGLEKTRAYDLQDKTERKLKKLIDENFDRDFWLPCIRYIIKECFIHKILKTEKSASDLLRLLQAKEPDLLG